jgi:hypothetical protein
MRTEQDDIMQLPVMPYRVLDGTCGSSDHEPQPMRTLRNDVWVIVCGVCRRLRPS